MGATAYRPLDALPRIGYPPAVYIQRVGAVITDGIIWLTLVALPVMLITWFGPWNVRPCRFQGDVEVCIAPNSSELWVNRGIFYALFALFIIWSSYQVGRTGQTAGRRATACMVVDARTQQPIGFRRALLRTLVKIVSIAPYGLGLLWPLWDSERRSFHDMIMRTRVVSP